MTKKIIVTAIAVSFVLGTLVSGTGAYGEEVFPLGTPLGDLWAAIVNLQSQIDAISSSIQTDGTSTLSFSEGDITLVAGENGKVNIVGDTKINSLLEVGPTNIDSETGNVLVGGNLGCNNPAGCIDSREITSQTLGKIECLPSQIVMRDSEGGNWECAEVEEIEEGEARISELENGIVTLGNGIATLDNEIVELNTFSTHIAFVSAPGEEEEVVTRVLSCEENDVIATWGFNVEEGGTLVKADISADLVSMTFAFLIPPEATVTAEIFCRGVAEEG